MVYSDGIISCHCVIVVCFVLWMREREKIYIVVSYFRILPCTVQHSTAEPPIYVGIYVDDFIYYSKLDKVKEWFKQQLKSHVKVDFMGDGSWFLGQHYEWNTDKSDGSVWCHVSQKAFIDRIKDNGIPVDDRKDFIRKYQ